MNEKYKVSPPQDKKRRKEIAEFIPLDTPLSMQLELASACNFRCVYCLHGDKSLRDRNFTPGIMDMDTLVTAVNQIKKFRNKLEFISLQSRGESFLNKNIIEMIKYIKTQSIAKEIAINTNATLLNPEMNKQLVQSGLDTIRISIQGVNKEQYLSITGIDSDFNALVRNIKNLYDLERDLHIYIKIINISMTEEDKKSFLDIFTPISDSIYIENPLPFWVCSELDIDFADARYGYTPKRVNVCPRLFFAMVVHYNGTVMACGSDWEETYPLGNIKETTLLDIWNSEQFNDLRINNLNGNCRKRALCAGCPVINNCEMDDIDGHAEEILKKLEAERKTSNGA